MTNASPSALVVRPPAAAPDFSTNDIRGAKPLMDIPNGWEWLWWVLGVVAVIVGVILLWRWWRKRADKPVIITPIPPHVRARQRLQEALQFLSDARVFCIHVSDALRTYLEERFHLRAPERTTEEFLQDLQRTDVLNSQQKLSLADFLERCDLVKFAKFEPTEAALKDLHEAALRLVDETQHDTVVAPGAGPATEVKP